MMRHFTQEEEDILEEMDNYDEDSEEYKQLQKKLIEIDKNILKNTPFQYD